MPQKPSDSSAVDSRMTKLPDNHNRALVCRCGSFNVRVAERIYHDFRRDDEPVRIIVVCNECDRRWLP